MCNKNGEYQLIRQQENKLDHVSVLEEQQRWQMEQGQKVLEKTQESYGIRNLYQNILLPVNSATISRELKEGPPRGLSKAEKKLWKEKMGILQKMAQEREKMFAPVERMNELARLKLEKNDQEKLQSVSDYAQIAVQMKLGTLVDFQKQPVKQQNLLEKQPKVSKLHSLMARLGEVTPEQVTRQQLIEMLKEYKGINSIASAVNEDEMDAAVKFENCQAGYLFLYHSVVSVLTYQLDKLPADQVDLEYFAELCGLEKALGLVAARMKLSEDYKNQKQEYLAAQESKRLRETDEKLEALRIYLRSGIIEKEKPEQWLLAPYAGIMEQELGERFTQPDYTMEEMVSRVREFEAAFRSNQMQLKKRVAEHPALTLQTQRDQVWLQIEQEINKNRLYPMQEEDISAAIKLAMDAISQELDLSRQRAEYLAALEELKDFLSMSPMPDMLQELLVSKNTQAEFQAQASLLSQQVANNLAVCQGVFKELLTNVDSAPVMEWLKKYHSVTLLGGTRAQVEAAARHCQNEDALSNIFAEEKRLRESIKRKQDMFKELTQDQRLQNLSWQQLLQWRDANITQEETQFRAGLESQIQRLTNIEKNQDVFAALIQNQQLYALGMQQLQAWREANLEKDEQEFRNGLEEQLEQQRERIERKQAIFTELIQDRQFHALSMRQLEEWREANIEQEEAEFRSGLEALMTKLSETIERKEIIFEALTQNQPFHKLSKEQLEAWRDANLEKDEQEFRKGLSELIITLRKSVERNQITFESFTRDQIFTASAWRDLLKWQEDNIEKEGKAFKEALLKELEEWATLEKKTKGLVGISKETFTLAEYLESAQQVEEIEEVQEEQKKTFVSLEEYLESTRHTQKTEKVQSRLEHLKGEGLCQWNVFSGFLRGYENAVAEALEKVLTETERKGALKLDFLQNVNGNADLDNLTYVEFQTLLNCLRVNMGKSIQSWRALEGLNAPAVRTLLLPEMLTGALDDKNFMDRAAEEEKKQLDRESAKAFRFKCWLKDAAVLPEASRKVEYRYLDDTDSTAIGTKESRGERRLRRFEKAGEIWDVIKECNKVQQAIEEIQKAGSGKYSTVKIMGGLQRILEPVRGTNRKVNLLYERLSNMREKDFEEFVHELRLCGAEGVFLSKKNNPEGYLAFVGSKHEEYEKKLQETGELALERMLTLEKILNQYVSDANDKWEKDSLRKRFSALAAGLQQGKKEENSKRFGVETWEKALEELEYHLQNKNDTTYQTLDYRNNLIVKQVGQRREQVRAYEKCMLWPVEELLYTNETFWTSMVMDNQKTFTDQLNVMGERLKVPLKLLETRYPYGPEFKHQIIDELGEEMISGAEKTRSEWIRLYDDCFERFCSHRLKNTSITDRYRKLMETDTELASCFTELMLNHPEGLGLMSNQNKLDARLKECKDCIRANTSTLNDFLKKKELSPIEEAGFRMYLQSAIPFTQAEEFRQGLGQWMESFKKLSAVNEERTAETQSVMSERAAMMLDVETRRHNGYMADREAQKLLTSLRTGMQRAGSPVLAALGIKKVPSEKQIKAAKDQLAAYGEFPQRVKNCLLERMLSGANKSELKRETEWLMQTSIQIDALDLKEHIAEELLTFLYLNHREENLTPDQVQAEYHALEARHAVVNELTDSELGREEERKIVGEALAVGIYTLDTQRFHELATSQAEYFKTAKMADTMFGDEIKDCLPFSKPEEHQRVLAALAEYFHEDIVKGRDHFQKNMVDIRKQTRYMLLDIHYCNHLLSEGKMESIGSDSLTGQEKKHHTLASRETLEQVLSRKENREFRAQYNALNREERQVFALCVLQTAPIDDLPSAQFVRSEDLQRARHTIVQEQLEKYVSRQAFQPEISYHHVMEILWKENGKLDRDVFETAMEQTRNLIWEHRRADLARLADGAQSIREARRLAGENEQEPAYGRESAQPVFSMKELKDWIMGQDPGQGAEQKEQLKQMDDYQMQLLGTVLQDRTMLDYTTRKQGKSENPRLVNEKTRAEVGEKIRRDAQGIRLYTANLTQVMNSLLGYQLRDDVELGRRLLRKSDFAPGALERTTQVDWALLQRAIDFVEEALKKTSVVTE